MERNGKHKGPADENNSEIMIDDLDTHGLSDSSMDSALCDSSSDSCDSDLSTFTLSSDVTKHSVNKNDASASTNSGKRKLNDSDVPTDITEKEDIENAEKMASYVRKVLRNEVHGEKKDWPLCLLIEANQSVNISQEELNQIILNKSAEVIAAHRKSQIAKQTSNYSYCRGQQHSYYKKYKRLLAYVKSVTTELELSQRVPDNQVYNVRNVGTYVSMPPKKE